jgi:hypothetical protein
LIYNVVHGKKNPLVHQILHVFSGVRVAQSLQAVKIQYGQRSEPAQTKPIQNKHKHCTHNFKNQSQQTDLRKLVSIYHRLIEFVC